MYENNPTPNQNKTNIERDTAAINAQLGEVASIKEQFKAYKEKIYMDYPEVLKFETRKERWLLFLFLAGLLLYLAKASLLRQTNVTSIPVLAVSIIMSFGIVAIFLLAAMSPKWRISGGLYFLALKDIVTYINTFHTAGIDSFEKFSWVYIDGFREYPFAVSLDFLSWIYTLLILLTAICLTLIPRNRELAEQSEPLHAQCKNFRPGL